MILCFRAIVAQLNASENVSWITTVRVVELSSRYGQGSGSSVIAHPETFRRLDVPRLDVIHRTLAVSFLGITLIVYRLGMDRLILFVISFDGNKALDSTSAFTKLETPDQWFPALNSLCRFRQPPTRDKAQPKMVSTAGLEHSASLKLTACFIVCMALLFLRQPLQSSPKQKMNQFNIYKAGLKLPVRLRNGFD